MLGGPRAPGIGFAIGEDRLVLTLLAQEAQRCGKRQMRLLRRSARRHECRGGADSGAGVAAQGLWIELGEGSFRLKKSFEAADKTARQIIILGEDELQSGILTVKNFSTGVQTKVPRGELAVFLSN